MDMIATQWKPDWRQPGPQSTKQVSKLLVWHHSSVSGMQSSGLSSINQSINQSSKSHPVTPCLRGKAASPSSHIMCNETVRSELPVSPEPLRCLTCFLMVGGNLWAHRDVNSTQKDPERPTGDYRTKKQKRFKFCRACCADWRVNNEEKMCFVWTVPLIRKKYKFLCPPSNGGCLPEKRRRHHYQRGPTPN